MSVQDAKGKFRYETPIIVPLGEIAKGSGVCISGSSVLPGSTGSCTAGPCLTPPPVDTDCVPGYTATRDCTEGTTACRDCTDAGVAALNACTAGNSAIVACTAGGAL